MANTKNTKKAQEEKVMKETKKVTGKKEVKKVVKPEVAKKEVKAPETKVAKKEKKTRVKVEQMTNNQLTKLFHDNGLATYSAPKEESNVVYNTFGTKSRVLQQGGAYQLLLTNGHALKKDAIVETDNDDTARFIQWYETLTDEQKGWVDGYATITSSKLSRSEMPRERQVKLTNYDLLREFLKFMATFEENQVKSTK
jgi:hypothetical protein